MSFEISPFLPELISVSIVAVFMAISPGADFVMVTRNSVFFGRTSGLYSSLGISLAIWIHVAYSIAGLALIISQSIVLFSLLKYLGAAYLIYIGWKTFRSSSTLEVELEADHAALSNLAAFKIGFITNALNPKTTIFFLSIFTQVVNPHTPIWVQMIYGGIISLCHLVWFSCVSIFLSQPALLKRFHDWKSAIEKVIGGLLIGLGVRVATTDLG
ncbi:lysine transporter LysE [Arenicella chitinivorans]|uniref:Lysine transporter LysE n=1 Tax=Arenicella chitinivorans TaxID=1329800 RepID=A0A918VT09_9GAMM|nr:LysE family transporter [Arenicella chitinivorans]GHA20331.1 lysine transporter LysE [Arenicella chitinivorans]